jgi:hypothetical protein
MENCALLAWDVRQHSKKSETLFKEALFSDRKEALKNYHSSTRIEIDDKVENAKIRLNCYVIIVAYQ